jgi:histidyl-tRNA synthetase
LACSIFLLAYHKLRPMLLFLWENLLICYLRLFTMQHENAPRLVKGTRDFDALALSQREYILQKIRAIYQQYGFTALETPAMEYLHTLMGYYGQEGEQLIFKVLNSGNFLADVLPENYADYKKLAPYMAEKGLRYDLTVPLMRYVATNYHQLTFPYRRYQIQPVWRADRPQQGRYREFYQCDADIIGSSGLLCEAELLTMAHQVMDSLGVKEWTLLFNHRLILEGIASLLGASSRVQEFCMILDKLDKIGRGGVAKEFVQKGFDTTKLSELGFIFEPPDPSQWFSVLQERLQHHPASLQALQTLQALEAKVKSLYPSSCHLQLDPTLARGLAYYTGTVFEIKIPSVPIGSIGGGGRYDCFADHFGVKNLTGVGLSFGIDRLHGALEALGLLPPPDRLGTRVLFTNLDVESENLCLPIVMACRSQGIATEIYPEPAPLKKQLAYAHKKAIPWVVMVGESERQAGQWLLKEMATGLQKAYPPAELITQLHLYPR